MNDIEKSINLANAVERLRKNRDFKLVFEETYFKEYPLLLVQMRSSQGAIRDKDIARYYDSRIVAVGTVQAWLDSVVAEGESAKEALNNPDNGAEE